MAARSSERLTRTSLQSVVNTDSSKAVGTALGHAHLSCLDCAGYSATIAGRGLKEGGWHFNGSLIVSPISKAQYQRHGLSVGRLFCAGIIWFALVPFVPVRGHFFVPRDQRAGAFPPRPGTGWKGEAFLNIPLESATHLLSVEFYVEGRTPDFTFRTPWIDFPAGPVDIDLDANFQTIGDFLNDYLFDVSDPSKLDEPMSHFFLRFTGLVKFRLSDEVRTDLPFIGMPLWADFATMGYDGYRTIVGTQTIYRVPDVNLNNNPWTTLGPSIEVLGLFPVTVTYFNRYDPTGVLGAEFLGIELYGYFPSEKDYPAGRQMFNERHGFGRLVPPDVVYLTDAEDVLPATSGDFDADMDIDLADAQWLQYCANPDFDPLPSGCHIYDVNSDGVISLEEMAAILGAMSNPIGANNKVSLP